jgi:DNA polymerase I-like protein with 3'-5' exonuclease and polymerase domains
MSNKRYLVINPAESSSAALELLDELEAADDLVSFDIETDGVVEAACKVIGISVSWEENQGAYLILREWDPEKRELKALLNPQDEKDLIDSLCGILQNKNLVMHNGVFDITVMKNCYGINLTDALVADTILLKHTLDEERPFGLKEIAEKYKEHIGFGEEEAANQEQLLLKECVLARGGKWNQKDKDIYMGEAHIIGTYACADTDLTLKLFNYLHPKLAEEGLEEFFYDLEVMPLYKKATIPMRMGGIFVDVAYFKALEKELQDGILKLTGEIFTLIEEDAQPYVRKLLDEAVKETRTGKFAEKLLQHYSIPIPVNTRTGKPTLAKSELRSLQTTFPGHPAIQWLLYEPPFTVETYTEAVEQEDGTTTEVTKQRKVPLPLPEDAPRIPDEVRYAIKREIFIEKNPELPHILNLSSNEDLSWLLFECYGVEPRSYSKETDKPQVDKNSLETYDDLPFIEKLLTLKKEEKLLSTYVNPILTKNVNGWLYPGMLQFGTTSGRYSCAGGLNLQTLPRDDKRIKKGFIAPPGYKVVNADFSALEPRIFSWVSGDEGLKNIWRNKLDLYSQIAIDVFGLEGVSADESAPNYLKKVMPEYRQKVKTFALAVAYGAGAGRISGLMKVDYQEAQQIIDRYLNAYPGLKRYIVNQHVQATNYGQVTTKFGRVRRLPKAKELFQKFGDLLKSKKKMVDRYGEEFGQKIYYEYRGYLNLSTNHPIQGTAGHVANAAMIKLADLFKEHSIDGYIALQVHDEITCIVREDQAEIAAEMLQDSMEDNRITREIDIPILAEPVISDNFADAK